MSSMRLEPIVEPTVASEWKQRPQRVNEIAVFVNRMRDEPFAEGDLYLSVMKGGPGLGDPLLRPVDQVERDVEEGGPWA